MLPFVSSRWTQCPWQEYKAPTWLQVAVPSDSLLSTPTPITQSREATCEHVSPSPAIQLQWPPRILPPSIAMNQGVSGFSRNFWEWVTYLSVWGINIIIWGICHNVVLENQILWMLSCNLACSSYWTDLPITIRLSSIGLTRTPVSPNLWQSSGSSQNSCSSEDHFPCKDWGSGLSTCKHEFVSQQARGRCHLLIPSSGFHRDRFLLTSFSLLAYLFFGICITHDGASVAWNVPNLHH